MVFGTRIDTALEWVIDGGGAVITTGEKGHRRVYFTGTIKKWTLMADLPGSIIIDIWKEPFSGYPPTLVDSICGGNRPTLSSQQSAEDSSLEGWTTQINDGDVLAYNVDYVVGIQRVTLSLEVDSIS